MEKSTKPEIPEYIIEMLERGESVDEIRLDKDGNWFHNGKAFTNKRIIEFFNKSIAMTGDGDYVLHYDKYVYPIIVEDAPIFITGVRIEGFGPFENVYCNCSTGNIIKLNPDTLYYKNGLLYCTVGEDNFPARFMRSPAFHILDRLEEQDGLYFINICGKRIQIKESVS